MIIISFCLENDVFAVLPTGFGTENTVLQLPVYLQFDLPQTDNDNLYSKLMEKP